MVKGEHWLTSGKVEPANLVKIDGITNSWPPKHTNLQEHGLLSCYRLHPSAVGGRNGHQMVRTSEWFQRVSPFDG